MGSSQLNDILHHPMIWPAIAGDVAMFDIKPRSDWILYWGDGGVVIFHPFRDGVKIHPNFLPEFRGKAAFKTIRHAMEEHDIIYAEIDTDLKHVNWAARYMGFDLIESNERNLYRWSRS